MPTTVSAARQGLSPEATAAVDEAISIARRRRHSQTTSLHVISALLSLPSSSSSLLRDALSRCRVAPAFSPAALELCFSAALDRLPSSNLPSDAPPFSNSLMAAVKRSQATQKRHPDTFHLYQLSQQQNSSAAVKVELQQLVLSILDDPVVSRVFAEGGFRSHEIKFAILRPPPSVLQFPLNGRKPPLFLSNFSIGADDFDFSSSLPLKCDASAENSRRIAQILTRKSGRNPLLVGVGANDAARDFRAAVLDQNWSSFPHEARGLEFCCAEQGLVEFISGARDFSSLAAKFGDVEKRFVLGLGDLKRLVDLVLEKQDGEYEERLGFLVKELTRLLEINRNRVWLMGSAATYEIYMKFLSFYPSVDKDWDLQLLPITSAKTDSICPLKVPQCDKTLMAAEKASDDIAASNEDPRLSTDLILGTKARGDFCSGGISEGEYVKELYKSLVDKVPWQREAAWAVSRAVVATRTHICLGLLGPDPVGKRKLAAALSESHFGGREKMISVDLSSENVTTRFDTICRSRVVNGFELNQRGKTVVDFLAGEIRRRPWTVVLLENVDHADLLVQESLLQAIRTGRLCDSHGREVNVGTTVFVATADYVDRESEFEFPYEKILAARLRGLKIQINEYERTNQKRRGSLSLESKSPKRPLTGLLDLNLPVNDEEDEPSASAERDAWMKEFLGEVDESVVFKMFDFDSVADEVVREVHRSCPSTVEIESAAMEQILAAAWVAESVEALTNWVRDVLTRSLVAALESRRVQPESCILTLVATEEAVAKEDRATGILLPARIPFA